MVEILEPTGKKTITWVRILSDNDMALGSSEKAFVVTETIKSQSKIKDEIQEPITKQITILFTDNWYFWEDGKQFDHIVETDTINPDETISPYIEEIQKYLTQILVSNPRREDYQSIYNTIKSQPLLASILENKKIQDWAHFDEKIYTEPTEDISYKVYELIQSVNAIKSAWEEAYAIHRRYVWEEKRVSLNKNMTERLLEDNTKLVNDASIEWRQFLHSNYQLTLNQLNSLLEKIESQDSSLNDLLKTMSMVKSKLDSYNKSFLNNPLSRKSRKIQKTVENEFPWWASQWNSVIKWLERQSYIYELSIEDIAHEIEKCNIHLKSLEEELINIFPPAKAMFEITQTEKKQLHHDEETLEKQQQKIQELKDDLEERKTTKDTFSFLYEEQAFLSRLDKSNIDKNCLSTCKKLGAHPSLSQEESSIYHTIQIQLQKLSQAQSNRNPNKEEIANLESSLSDLSEELSIYHNKRFGHYEHTYPIIAWHFSAIKQYTQQIQITDTLIAQERKNAWLPRNESNPQISDYNAIISSYKKSIKDHEQSISSYIQDAATGLELAEKEEKNIWKTLSQRKVTIQSTQNKITNLLADPNKLIVVKDISKLKEKLAHHEHKLLNFNIHIHESKKDVSNQTDLRYQEMLWLHTIIEEIQTHRNDLIEIETILSNYLPPAWRKMSDLDRDIRKKRDDIYDARILLSQLAWDVRDCIQDTLDTNPDLTKNTPILEMKKNILHFIKNINTEPTAK